MLDFYVGRRACKTCTIASRKDYRHNHYIKNKAKVTAQCSLWAKSHPEKVKASQTRFRDKTRKPKKVKTHKTCSVCRVTKTLSAFNKKGGKCKSCLNKIHRNYYAQNSDKCNARSRSWKQTNRGRVNAARRKRAKLTYALNPEPMRIKNAARRAKVKAAEGSHSLAEWIAVCLEFNEQCVCCCKRVGIRKLEKDHIVALDNGGSNDISNIQPLCKSCNCAKGARHSTDYRPFEPNINILLNL